MLLRISLVLALIATQTVAQIKVDKRFSKVPQQWREKLVEKLNLYFEYERAADFDTLYDMLTSDSTRPFDILYDPSDSSLTDKKPTKEEFIRKNRTLDANSWRFVPIKAKVVDVTKDEYNSNEKHQIYFLWVKLKSKYGERIVEEERSVEAHFENGDWYFRMHHIEI